MGERSVEMQKCGGRSGSKTLSPELDPELQEPLDFELNKVVSGRSSEWLLDFSVETVGLGWDIYHHQ